MRTVAIVQARTGSKRLPSKILKSIGALPLFKIVYDRVASSNLIDEVVFATTVSKGDDEFCQKLSALRIPFYRGSEADVLMRFKEAADFYEADVVVRITCDDPFKDPDIIDKCLLLMKTSNAEFCSNVIEKTYAEGMDVECMSKQMLDKMSKNASKDYQREHITQYFYENRELFKFQSLKDVVDLSQYRLTVDDMVDLELMTDIYEELDFNYSVSYEELKELIQSNSFRPRLVGRIKPYAGLVNSKED